MARTHGMQGPIEQDKRPPSLSPWIGQEGRALTAYRTVGGIDANFQFQATGQARDEHVGQAH